MIEDQNKFVLYFPLVPFAIVTLACILIVLQAWFSARTHSGWVAGLVDCGLKLTAPNLVIIVIAVGLLTGVEMALLTGLSSFCEDIDTNTLSYINSTTHEMSDEVYTLAEYYIRGTVANPAQEYDDMIMHYVNMIQSYYNEPYMTLSAISGACPAFFEMNLNSLMAQARDIIDRAKALIQPEHIWPLYRTVWRDGMCTQVLDTVAWMWLLQIITGLVLLPMCASFTHIFLVEYEAWNEASERVRQAEAERDAEEPDDWCGPPTCGNFWRPSPSTDGIADIQSYQRVPLKGGRSMRKG